jgi:mRNA interferase HigB
LDSRPCGFKSRPRYSASKLDKTSENSRFFADEFPYWELLYYLFTEYKVRFIAKSTLRSFWQKHSNCEQQLKAWYDEASNSEWNSVNSVKTRYPSASILTGNRVVFNIKGNSYRLIVKINYKFGIVWIRFVGTHAEYDKIDATTI